MLDRLTVLRSGRGRLLLAGDLVALLAFAVIGRRSHAEETGLEAAGAVLGTAAPFLVGWVVALVVLRVPGPRTVDGPRAVEGPRELVGAAARVWVVAFPIAVLVRAIGLGRFSPWTFYVVAFLAAFALLAIWRVAFAYLGRRGASAVR